MHLPWGNIVVGITCKAPQVRTSKLDAWSERKLDTLWRMQIAEDYQAFNLGIGKDLGFLVPFLSISRRPIRRLQMTPSQRTIG